MSNLRDHKQKLCRHLRAALALLLTLVLPPARAAEPLPPQAQALVTRLQMQRIPHEGAWFAPAWRAAETLGPEAWPARYGAIGRALGSSIFALVTRRDFSALHRLRLDETWHFYAGDPLELLVLKPDGGSERIVLGGDVLAGQRPQYTVAAGNWMGARPLPDAADAYTLFGCTLAPAFDASDYQPGERAALQQRYPAQAALIEALTRTGSETLATPPPTPPARAAAQVVDSPAAAGQEVTPGVVLRELVGRNAGVRRTDYSVAHFTLAAGAGTARSYNRHGEELILVLAGEGEVELDGLRQPLSAGSVVLVHPGVRHRLSAGAAGLSFQAVTMPAFSAEDYVVVD